jgi:sugar phosphate isomerase/epimerase
MKLRQTNRRVFIRDSFAVAATAALLEPGAVLFGRASAAEPRIKPIRLGGPSFVKADDPDALALAHRQLGYRAAYCPGVSLKDTDRIRALTEAFAKHDVVIAEVGRWCNLLDADPEKRRKNLETVTEGLALAEAIGARCCVDIAGSFNPTSWFGPHPDNLSQKFFDAAVENARKIIDAVKPKRARFTYEAMGWALPDSPDSYVKLIKAVQRPAFGVHLDPCNLVNSPDKFYHNTALLNECFDKLGRWIVSCHAKDLTWDIEMNVHFREVPPGKGSLDYATYLKRVAELPQNPPLMLEHLVTAEEYAGAREHIFEVGRKAALSFG